MHRAHLYPLPIAPPFHLPHVCAHDIACEYLQATLRIDSPQPHQDRDLSVMGEVHGSNPHPYEVRQLAARCR